jgi:hypothetical protein
MFPNDGKDIDAGFAGLAESFGDAAFGVEVAVLPEGELGDNFIADFDFGPVRLGGRIGDVEVVDEAGIVGDDDVELADFGEGADKVAVASPENADDSSGEPVGATSAVAFGSVDADEDKVLVEGGEGIFSRDEDIFGIVLRDEKSESFLIELEDAGDQTGDVGKDPVIAFDAGDLAFEFEGFEGLGEFGPVWAGKAESFRKFRKFPCAIFFATE